MRDSAVTLAAISAKYVYVSSRPIVFYASVTRHNKLFQTVLKRTYFMIVIDGVLRVINKRKTRFNRHA